MPDFDDNDNVLQVPECIRSGTMSLRSGNVLAMSDFAVDVDAEFGEASLPSGVHLDTSDFADLDNVLLTPECVSFGEPGSGTMSPGSGNVLAMSDFAGDIDAEHDGPLLLSGVHFDMPDYADVSIVLWVPDCVDFGEQGSGTVSPGPGVYWRCRISLVTLILGCALAGVGSDVRQAEFC